MWSRTESDEPLQTRRGPGRRTEKGIILAGLRPYMTAGDHTTSKDWRRAMLMAPLGTDPTDDLLINKRHLIVDV